MAYGLSCTAYGSSGPLATMAAAMIALAVTPTQCRATRQVGQPIAANTSTSGSRNAHSLLPNASTEARSIATHPAATAVLMCCGPRQNPLVSDRW